MQTKSFCKLLPWLGILSLVAATPAQSLYKINFKGTVSGVDASGNEFVQRISNKSLIQDWAARAPGSNPKDLVLAYRRNADGKGGDTIEIVNKSDGTTAVTIFPMASPETASATSAKSLTQRRFLYVYDIYQPGFSMGTADLNERTLLKKTGETNKIVLDGQMQWYWLPDNGTNALRIGSARFNVKGKPLTFKAQ